jgi:hypothetical protein
MVVMNTSEHADWASDTSNPYAAPRSTLPKATIKPKLELLIAKRLLEAHERGGLTVGLSLRWNALRFAILAIYFLVGLAILGYLQLWTFFALLLGMVLGIFLTNYGWIRTSVRVWSFNERVIDWEKVRQIAEGNE